MQLQIADLLAGATATFCKSLLQPVAKSGYAEALKESGIEEFNIGGLWPSTDVDPDTLETVGQNTGSLVDFVADLLRRKKNSQ